jgi:hypothetical protein
MEGRERGGRQRWRGRFPPDRHVGAAREEDRRVRSGGGRASTSFLRPELKLVVYYIVDCNFLAVEYRNRSVCHQIYVECNL